MCLKWQENRCDFFFQVFCRMSREKDTLTSWHHLFWSSIRRLSTVPSGHLLETRAVTTAAQALCPCTSNLQFSAAPQAAVQLTQAKYLGAIFRFSVKSHMRTVSKWFKLYFSDPSRISLISPPACHHAAQTTTISHPYYWKSLWHGLLLPTFAPSPLQSILSYNNSLNHKPNLVTSLNKVHQWLPGQHKSQSPTTPSMARQASLMTFLNSFPNMFCCYSSNTLGTLPPQGLCICCFVCLILSLWMTVFFKV